LVIRTYKKKKYFLDKFKEKSMNYYKVNNAFWNVTRVYGIFLDSMGITASIIAIFISLAYVKNLSLLGTIIVYLCLYMT